MFPSQLLKHGEVRLLCETMKPGIGKPVSRNTAKIEDDDIINYGEVQVPPKKKDKQHYKSPKDSNNIVKGK